VVDFTCDVSTGLGVNLAGNRNLDKMSVFIAAIHPNGAVARDGRIRVGDELLEVCRQTALTSLVD
jgi:PDZ domain